MKWRSLTLLETLTDGGEWSVELLASVRRRMPSNKQVAFSIHQGPRLTNSYIVVKYLVDNNPSVCLL